MAKMPAVDTQAVELVIAKRLGLDPAQIVAGSIHIDVGNHGEIVTWKGRADFDPGFMSSVFNEVSGR